MVSIKCLGRKPSDWKNYKFHVINHLGTNVTVQIQQKGHTQTYNIVANGSTTWIQSASDRRIFEGDVSVSGSDVPLKEHV